MMVLVSSLFLLDFFLRGSERCGPMRWGRLVLVTSRACTNQVICSIVRINMGRRRPNLLNRALPVSNNASPSSRCFRTSILRRGGSFHSAMARD